MRINGQWLLCDDGIVRPIARGHIETADGDCLRLFPRHAGITRQLVMESPEGIAIPVPQSGQNGRHLPQNESPLR